MDKTDIKQVCLDLSNASIALFDLIEEEGESAPMEGLENIASLKKVIDNAYLIIDFYQRKNIRRMMALGVSPETILRMAGAADD